MPDVAQPARQPVHADLRAGEHDRLSRPLLAEHARERLRLLAIPHLEVELLHGVDRQRGRSHLDLHRVVHEGVRQAPDLGGHGGAEERRLAAHRTAAEDRLHVLEEAQVEHLVGLVEDHVARRVEDQVMAVDHVEHAPDGADHHLRVRARGARPARGSARRRRWPPRPRRGRLAVCAQRLGHLDAELARGREHDRLDVRVLGIDVVHHRQPERGRLAGAGLRLPDHVAAPRAAAGSSAPGWESGSRTRGG